MLDEVARWRLRGETNASHPFEHMARGLVRQITATTGVTIELPMPVPVRT
jgi:hypothetical protein